MMSANCTLMKRLGDRVDQHRPVLAYRGAQVFAVEPDERVAAPHGDALAVQVLSHQLGVRHGEQDEGGAAVDDIQADVSQRGHHVGAQRRQPSRAELGLGDCVR